MKKKSERLKVVVQLAQRKEFSARDELIKKRRYRDEQQTQLEGLIAYQTQSVQDLKSKISNIHDVNSLQSGQNFIFQIDQAISQQNIVNERAKIEYAQALSVWVVAHQKSKGMADLVLKYKKQEEIEADNLIEKQIENDFISRRYR